jgi:hypothetical protein
MGGSKLIKLALLIPIKKSTNQLEHIEARQVGSIADSGEMWFQPDSKIIKEPLIGAIRQVAPGETAGKEGYPASELPCAIAPGKKR